ncbi:hypothetical protein CA606_18330 [Caulobacter vibrioides]|uniref:Uncharacterized protein n=1 Tax=Caulobacter vibrioides TaxID=155892 RepID=A0A290MQ46_CAUVI|nr:hypothetical protein [Caulobacter vibrioides]ATC34132.1 hypothetical protein CA606_18330 [Caulobacter vibrioides]
MTPKPQPPNDKHEALYQELVAVMRKYELSQVEILAVVANITGKCLAFQDQTKGTADDYMQIVIANLEEGNRQALDGLLNPIGRA